ncbi:hypothetical protein DMA12_20940 [Amycolatopsis balhimycina DSM 5908]|uniref:Uncharacterized protein n=1 Tax=Amycolatopsis balhimycina DSM 5908 TaxID=1081091 RepID=A0A428WHX0_AMYBA|nr:hypothetical protein [Amycolatopsis balhimycina]RSM42689.1 hypothetical protein DMA12_20940 [Amycolatopsis balhimycina DSM 5908]
MTQFAIETVTPKVRKVTFTNLPVNVVALWALVVASTTTMAAPAYLAAASVVSSIRAASPETRAQM